MSNAWDTAWGSQTTPTVCSTTGVCGTGGWSGPKPGDPDTSNVILSAVPAFGGVDVSWTFPATNPEAVGYTLLYRNTNDNFTGAVQQAVVSGNFYYDRIAKQDIKAYYYWIQMVSINGTVGKLIGPATAIPKGLIEEVMRDLTGLIDEGILAQSLRDTIGGIGLNATKIAEETLTRISESEVLMSALAGVQSATGEALTLLSSETTQRQNENEALVNSFNVMAAGMKKNTAAILEESTVRATQDSAMADSINTLVAKATAGEVALTNESLARSNADGAIGLRLDTVVATSAETAAAIQTIDRTKIGYAALRNTSNPYDGNGSTEVYPAKMYPANTYPEYAANRKRIIDKLGVTLWNTTGAGIAKPLDWVVGLPLATAVKTVSVTGPNGQEATLEQSFTAQKGLNDKYNALYTVKTNVNGLIGGFGMLNDGQTVQMGFDVDSFWVGRTNADGIKPFIIDNGVTYINDAAINKLTFSKLRDSTGNFVVGADGKVKANYLNVQEMNVGSFTHFGWPPAGQGGAHLSSAGFAIGNANNGGKYFVIGSGHGTGGNAELYTNIPAFVDTLHIRGNAVTTSVGASTQSGNTATASINIVGTATVIVLATVNCPSIGKRQQLLINDVEVAYESVGGGSVVSFNVMRQSVPAGIFKATVTNNDTLTRNAGVTIMVMYR